MNNHILQDNSSAPGGGTNATIARTLNSIDRVGDEPAPVVLDICGVKKFLSELGFAPSLHQVRRWASEGTLPFYRLGRKLWISRAELMASLQRLQLDAVRRRENTRHSSPSRRKDRLWQ